MWLGPCMPPQRSAWRDSPTDGIRLRLSSLEQWPSCLPFPYPLLGPQRLKMRNSGNTDSGSGRKAHGGKMLSCVWHCLLLAFGKERIFQAFFNSSFSFSFYRFNPYFHSLSAIHCTGVLFPYIWKKSILLIISLDTQLLIYKNSFPSSFVSLLNCLPPPRPLAPHSLLWQIPTVPRSDAYPGSKSAPFPSPLCSSPLLSLQG